MIADLTHDNPYSLTLAEVGALADQGNLIPLYREIVADLETPVSAYLKVARGPYSFLLESVEGGERMARYSFIGTDPYTVLRFADGALLRWDRSGATSSSPCADPLAALRAELASLRQVPQPGLPPLVGGAVGYLAYEVVRCYERLPIKDTETLGVPDAIFMLTDTVLAFDHLRHSIKVMTHVRLDNPAVSVERAYHDATRRIEELVGRLDGPLPAVHTTGAPPRDVPPSNMSQGEHAAAIARIKEYIMAGDAIQVVYSQRFARPLAAAPFNVYRALRMISPAPYMYYLQLGDFQIAGASVELLVSVQGDSLTYHPIAGTRPRGRTPEEDAERERELRADVKEKAEHIMLVDLGRNDIGRVATTGSVRVTELMGVARYSHVMHLESTIEARLSPDWQPLDALRVCLPAGTLAGAPKVRAMEIIAELEPGPRGPYAGAVGYISYSGDLDTCINFRMAVMKDGVAYVQAGGGIVADSVAQTEYEETQHKAAAVLRAIERANALATA